MGQGRYRLWAGVISVVFHVVVLSVLAISNLHPQPQTINSDEPADVVVARIRDVTDNPPVISKPGIRRRPDEKLVQRRMEPPDLGIRFRPIAVSSDTEPDKIKTTGYADILWQSGDCPRQEVKFFSSTSVCERVCFLVDCSGSMRGLMGRVREELCRSIQSLKANQYFGIVFFGGGRVIEFGEGKLVRAGESAKKRALSFVRSVQAAGGTNAPAGFRAAVGMRDDAGQGPEVILFLTDGFELSAGDVYQFRREILRLRREYLAGGVVSTIGFWPSEKDRRLLESIAYSSGGEFVCVGEEDF